MAAQKSNLITLRRGWRFLAPTPDHFGSQIRQQFPAELVALVVLPLQQKPYP
jgi:hypothetical protein